MYLFKPGYIPNRIFVIGAGGIGSRLVPLVVQFCAKTVRSWLPNLEIYVVDPDVIEEKNLLRQNFIEPDVGQSKAFVLAQRYGGAMDFPVIPIQQKFSDFAKERTVEFANSLMLMCLDSKAARQDSLLHMNFSGNLSNAPTVIDGGNENTYGQVHLCTLSNVLCTELKEILTREHMDKGRIELNYLNFDEDFYMSKETSKASEMSCADLDQTLAINTMVATAMMGLVQNIFFRQPVSYKRINFDLNYGANTQVISLRDLINTHNSSVKVPRRSIHLLDGETKEFVKYLKSSNLLDSEISTLLRDHFGA